MFQFAYLGHYPFWSFTMIVIDILVIYGLAARRWTRSTPRISVIDAVLATTVHWGSGWKWAGSFTTLDLIAAGTNALNGALLVRRPDHFKNYTVVGVMLMALLMGLGGGMTRDVLVNQIPSALTNPAYLTVTLIAGVIGYRLAFAKGQLFREGLFQFMTSFSLPLYAIVGAQKGVDCRSPRSRRAAARGGRPHCRALVRRCLQRSAAEALRARRMVRRHRTAHRTRLGALRYRGAQHVGVRRHRVCRRLRPPGDCPVPRVGGAPGEGTRGRLHPRRRATAARSEASGQVGARDAEPRPHDRRHTRRLMLDDVREVRRGAVRKAVFRAAPC